MVLIFKYLRLFPPVVEWFSHCDQLIYGLRHQVLLIFVAFSQILTIAIVSCGVVLDLNNCTLVTISVLNDFFAWTSFIMIVILIVGSCWSPLSGSCAFRLIFFPFLSFEANLNQRIQVFAFFNSIKNVGSGSSVPSLTSRMSIFNF